MTKQTPEPYRQWLKLIDDSLDQRIEENDYQHETFQEICSLIKEEGVSPQEAFRMKDEYSEEEYLQDEREKGIKEGIEKGMEKEKKETAKVMIKEGLEWILISKITGISIQVLKGLNND